VSNKVFRPIPFLLATVALGSLAVSQADGPTTDGLRQLNLFAVGFPITVIPGLLVLLFGKPFPMPILEGTLVMGLKLFTG
jgi:flagellar biosynthetic protein FliR